MSHPFYKYVLDTPQKNQGSLVQEKPKINQVYS